MDPRDEHILELQAQNESLSALMDRLPMGVLIVNGSGKIMQYNERAEMILEDNDGLSQGRHKRLNAAVAQEMRRLHKIILGATQSDPSTVPTASAMVVSRPSGKQDYSVMVMPLDANQKASANGESLAAVLVTDPDRRVETREKMLRRLYELSPTEARLAILLMKGMSREQAAAELGRALNTVRAHLRQIFAKTGTSRQGELIALLLSGPVNLRDKRKNS